jgi:hypothetical protein
VNLASGDKERIKEALRARELFIDSYNKRTQRHITFEPSRTVIHASDKDKIYVPSATGELFHTSNGFVDLIMGPYGSGKTTMCIQRIVKSACRMPCWFNGRRRSRWAMVRNTSGELQSTTLNSWLTWFGDLGDVRRRQKPLLTYEHTFNDGDGIIELELIFIALDRPEDVRKIKSLELTGAYLNELSELPQNVLSHFKGRVNGRYPSKSFCSEPYWSGIIADTNPPSDNSWIYEDFEIKDIEGYNIFHQPPGLIKNDDNEWIRNPNADNAKHLSDDYYVKLASGQTEEFVKVFCLGKYGTVGLGKIVYPEFNSDLHAVSTIDAIQGEPIHLAFDFGLTPACVVAQMSARGQLRILKEYIGTDIGLRSFVESIVLPSLEIDFPYCKIGISVGDPAGAARDQILEEMSCISELNSLGIKTHIARTNEINSRIAAVRYFLNKLVDRQPSFVLSKKGCPTLYNAFVRDYIYKQLAVSGEPRYREIPEKNMASHVSDATQYLCLEFAADSIAKAKEPIKPKVDPFFGNTVMRWQN